MTTQSTIRLAAVAVVCLAGSGCAVGADSFATRGSFERALQVTGPVDLNVTTGSGRIQIHTGARNEVRIVGSIQAYGDWWTGARADDQVKRLEANPPIDQSGNAIRIGDIKDMSLRHNVSISYELIVPADTNLRSRTGSGGQDIDGVNGPLEASAGSGSIKAGHIAKHVTASTGSGSIEISDAGDGLEVSAGSGSIRGDGISGAIRARTGSGHVELRQEEAGDVEVTTGSGGISLSGARGPVLLRAGSGSVTVDGNPVHDWALRTGSGSINVRVPPDAKFDLDARSGSGSIHTAHSLEVNGEVSSRRLEGKVRGGGARIETSTGSGSTHIE